MRIEEKSEKETRTQGAAPFAFVLVSAVMLKILF